MKLDVAVQLKHTGWKKLLRPYCKTTCGVCHEVLSETKLGKSSRRFEMTVVLADDKFIRELNRDYRGHDKPTNVLSFPSSDLKSGGRGDCFLGDVVLAYETVEREAREQKKNARQHAIHLLAHGILHLLGYDHMNEKEARRMEALEIKILKKQGINNPYL